MNISELTLAQLATEFLEQPGYAPSTRRSYELTLLPLLQEYGRRPLVLLSRNALEDYLNQLTHLAVSTHRRHQAVLQSLMNFAVERGYLKSNPIARLKRRQPDRVKHEHHTDELVRYLTPRQLELLYSASQSDVRTHTLIHLLHRTGARIAEILALDLEDINLVEHKFQVVGKGNKSRWCFYDGNIEQVLSKYLRFYRHSDSPALFTAQQPFSKTVSRLSYATAYKDWKRLTAPYPELADVRMHDLRHTFATERVGLMGIEELRALLGHQDIQTTLRYQKVTSSRAEKIAKQALEQLQI